MNKEIASQIILLFESCNQLKFLAEETPDYQYLKTFSSHLYHGLNDLFSLQELQKFESSLAQLLANVIEFQAHNASIMSSEVGEQIQNMKKNIIEIQKLIENE